MSLKELVTQRTQGAIEVLESAVKAPFRLNKMLHDRRRKQAEELLASKSLSVAHFNKLVTLARNNPDQEVASRATQRMLEILERTT